MGKNPGKNQIFIKDHLNVWRVFIHMQKIRSLAQFIAKMDKISILSTVCNGYQPAWNEFAIANGYWAIPINSDLYPQLDFGLYWGCLEAEITKLHLGKFSRPNWIRSSPKILAQPQGSLSSKILPGSPLLIPHPVEICKNSKTFL